MWTCPANFTNKTPVLYAVDWRTTEHYDWLSIGYTFDTRLGMYSPALVEHVHTAQVRVRGTDDEGRLVSAIVL